MASARSSPRTDQAPCVVKRVKLPATPVLDDVGQRMLPAQGAFFFFSRRPDAGPSRCPRSRRARRAPAMPCTDRAAIRHCRTKIASSPRAASRTAGAASSACTTWRGPRCRLRRWGECRSCAGRSRPSAGTPDRRRAASGSRSRALCRCRVKDRAPASSQRRVPEPHDVFRRGALQARALGLLSASRSRRSRSIWCCLLAPGDDMAAASDGSVNRSRGWPESYSALPRLRRAAFHCYGRQQIALRHIATIAASGSGGITGPPLGSKKAH